MTYDCENKHQQCGDDDSYDGDVSWVRLLGMFVDGFRIKFGCGQKNLFINSSLYNNRNDQTIEVNDFFFR